MANLSNITLPDSGRMIPVPKWPDFHPWPTVSAVRNQIFHRKQNGLIEYKAIVKCKGRWLMDEPRYQHWMRNSGEKEERV